MVKDPQREINEKLESFFGKGAKRNEVNLYNRFYECEYDEEMVEDFEDYIGYFLNRD